MLKCFNQASNLLLDIKDNRRRDQNEDNNRNNKSLSTISIPLDPKNSIKILDIYYILKLGNL
jgi:hypothetical protein